MRRKIKDANQLTLNIVHIAQGLFYEKCCGSYCGAFLYACQGITLEWISVHIGCTPKVYLPLDDSISCVPGRKDELKIRRDKIFISLFLFFVSPWLQDILYLKPLLGATSETSNLLLTLSLQCNNILLRPELVIPHDAAINCCVANDFVGEVATTSDLAKFAC